MAFVTPELHVIPPQLLFAGSDPTHSQVAKVFSSEQVKAIYAEFEGVQALGHATAEEWVKGLENRGKRSLADASRWERWYLTGGVHDMRTSLQSLHSSTQTIGAASSTRVLDAQAPVNESQKPGGDVMQTRDPPTPIIGSCHTAFGSSLANGRQTSHGRRLRRKLSSQELAHAQLVRQSPPKRRRFSSKP